MVNRFQKIDRLSNRRLWISRPVKGSLSAWRPFFQKDSTSTAGKYRRLRSVCDAVRAMSRGAIEREQKFFFFAKIKKSKTKIESSKKRTNAKSKNKNKNLSGNFETGKRIAEAKTLQSFQSVSSRPEVRRTSCRNPGAVGPWTSPVHLPVDASSLHEEIEPLLAGRTILLKKVRCGLNLEQR
jgi:hypothetical protein